MPIASGSYIITNVKQRNPIFLENRNDEESIRGHYWPENPRDQWHWRVIDLKNGCHLIQNIEHKRYANCGSRAGPNSSVMGASEEQQWHIQAISDNGEYTIGAIDSRNFWMLPDKEKGTPVGLFNIPTDRKCWWTFTNVETGAPVKEDATCGAYLFELNPLPILPFSPLRLDFVIIQQMPGYSISHASRTIAGICGRLLSLGRVQCDALCINIIEVTAIESEIFFERSCDVVTLENLRKLEGSCISWEECDGASSLPPMAMRGLRANTTKVAILNLSDTLFQQGSHGIIELTKGLAEHDITLILTPIQPTRERTFCDSGVFKELKRLSPEYRRFRQEGQFSDYVINYHKSVALPRLKNHPELRDRIRPSIPHIIDMLRDDHQDPRSAAVTAFSQLAEYTELRGAILQAVPMMIEILSISSAAQVAALALIEFPDHAQLRRLFTAEDKNGRTLLSLAAIKGNDAAVGRLLTRGDVEGNAKDNNGRTPLSLAAVNGHSTVVSLLLAQASVETNSADEAGQTPLSLAATLGHDAVVGLLLAHSSVDVNAKDKDGRTPLSMAVLNGHEPVVRLLLAHPDVDVNTSGGTMTPLLGAASMGYDAVVRLLLTYPGVDVNAKNKDGLTPLLGAVLNGHEPMVRLLLTHPGVDVNAKNKDGLTPLLGAALKGHEVAVSLLLAHPSVDVNNSGGTVAPPLLAAASMGHGVVVRLLMAHPDVDVNTKNKDDLTLLSIAAAGGHDVAARLLLAHPDVDINARGGTMPPLLGAALMGYDAVVRLLLTYPGVDVNAKNKDGLTPLLGGTRWFGGAVTPLLAAALTGHGAVVRLLLAHPGVDINAKDGSGLTPLAAAASNGHEVVVKLVQEQIQQMERPKWLWWPFSP